MKRYYIEDAKCDITRGGVACGPMPGAVVGTVQYNDGTGTKWLNLIEVDGIPNWYVFDKDLHDEFVKDDFEDKEFTEFVEAHFIEEFDGIEAGEYPDIFCSIKENPDNPAGQLLRYAIALVCCSMDELEDIIQMAKGKYIDEIAVPLSDTEEEWLEELEEYEDEED